MFHHTSGRRTNRPAALWAFGALLALAAPAAAQPAPEATGGTPVAVVSDGPDRGTPRVTAVGYLSACREGDYERAARYLDLRRIDPADRASQGPELARKLKVVLDRTLWVPVDELSDEPEGQRDDPLGPNREGVGVIEARAGNVRVELQRVPNEAGAPVWLFAAATVAHVPELYDEFGYGPLERFLPEAFFEFRLLEVLLWQWLALLALVFFSWVLSYLVSRGIMMVLKPLVARTQTDLDDRLFESALPPLRLVLTILFFWVGTLPLGLAVPARELLGAAERALVLVGFAWLVIRLVDVVSEAVEQRLEARGEKSAVPLVSPSRKAVKAVIFLVAFVAILDNFGFNVTALVAGLGVGGIAVALAAQKSIENLFGGVMLYADRPVRVGEFCRFGDKVGTVEYIGLRSTRVRTLDRTLVTVPNAEFSALQLENFARRDFIRLYTTIGLRYETTPDQLRHILVETRRLLYAHPMISNDPARVRFVGFGAYSLDLEVFAYATTNDWAEFLGIREDVYLRIMDLVQASGTGFAFPSQTLYLAKDGGLDDERARAAEAEVAACRERGDLLLPDFPDERIAALSGEHPWPPAGSPKNPHASPWPERGGER